MVLDITFPFSPQSCLIPTQNPTHRPWQPVLKILSKWSPAAAASVGVNNNSLDRSSPTPTLHTSLGPSPCDLEHSVAFPISDSCYPSGGVFSLEESVQQSFWEFSHKIPPKLLGTKLTSKPDLPVSTAAFCTIGDKNKHTILDNKNRLQARRPTFFFQNGFPHGFLDNDQ